MKYFDVSHKLIDQSQNHIISMYNLINVHVIHSLSFQFKEEVRKKEGKAFLQTKKNDIRFSHSQRSFKEKSSTSPFPSYPGLTPMRSRSRT